VVAGGSVTVAFAVTQDTTLDELTVAPLVRGDT
jgi:hypothetical protein